MATDLNNWTGVGRLVADPELRQLQNGTAVCQVRIAVNASKKSPTGDWEDIASFFNVTVWGKQAESVVKNCTKGTRVAISGRLNQRTWKAEDGSNREQVGIVADRVQFVEPRPAPAQTVAEPSAQDEVPF